MAAYRPIYYYYHYFYFRKMIEILLSNDLFYFPVLIFHYRSKLGSCYRRLNRTHLLMVFSPWAAVTRE